MIQIRPEIGMYAAFARLNYKPWFALAEFVDNSLQSATANITALRKRDGADYRLRVDINLSHDSIEIRDNAAGIAEVDYARAFLPAAPPPDTSGLSEFGLGMKAAASWFSNLWSVRTKALNDVVERTIIFDIADILQRKIDQLEPIEAPSKNDAHYTTVHLQRLNVFPRGNTVKKIKSHLGSIYRIYIRDNLLDLYVDGERIDHMQPKLLTAAYHRDQSAKPVRWYKDFSIAIDETHSISGWAGLLETGSLTNAGFALFRRRRLILGSAGDTYRPEIIFGKANKYAYQRLVGEVEVHGFSVSHTKDGLQWDQWEDDILHALKRELNLQPLPLLEQAEHYRVRNASPENAMNIAVNDAMNQIVQSIVPSIEQQLRQAPTSTPLPTNLPPNKSRIFASKNSTLTINHSHRNWHINLSVIQDPAVTDWYELSFSKNSAADIRIQLRLNLSHPFLSRFIGPDGEELPIFSRLAIGLAISEITARETGVSQAGIVRRNLNNILRDALSGPINDGGKNNDQ